MILNSPLEQFWISSIFQVKFCDICLHFTNSSAFMLIGCILMYVVYSLSIFKAKIIPTTNWQFGVESLYGFIMDMVENMLGDEKTAGKYFPFFFFLFSFILFNNLVGMVPYSFCLTSHIAITFTLGIIIWVGTTIIGFRTHGRHFFGRFMPSGAPFAIMPFLITIEVLSYVFTVISISVRLFANMMAGHSLLKILAGFAWVMLSGGIVGVFGAGITLFVVTLITGLEVGIAFLQAYVFTMLSCMYLADCITLH